MKLYVFHESQKWSSLHVFYSQQTSRKVTTAIKGTATSNAFILESAGTMFEKSGIHINPISKTSEENLASTWTENKYQQVIINQQNKCLN